jgi:hypothetical protein
MYVIRNAETSQFFQGMDGRQDPIYDATIVEGTPKWTDFEECQTFILTNALSICEVFTIPE